MGEYIPTYHEEPTSLPLPELASQPALVVLSGTRAGHCLRLEPGIHVLGRSRDVALFLDDESVSRRHAELVVTPEGRCFIRDLNSTNGTRVNGQRIGAQPRPLLLGDRVQLSSSVTLKLNALDPTEVRVQQRLYDLALHDPLTGAYNRRYLDERIGPEFAYALRHGCPLTLSVLDLDRFKLLNDTYGHDAGDTALRETARLIRENIREEDLFVRFGGEEFVLLMRHTPLEDACLLTERIRARVAAAVICYRETPLPVTLSIGLSSSEEEGCCSGVDLFTRADQRLYKAKESGRNRICAG